MGAVESAAVHTLTWVVPLIPALPLIAFLITIIFGKWYIKESAHWLPILAMAASFVLSIITWWNIRGAEEPFVRTLWNWIPVGKLQVPIALQVDQLTAVMLLVVTGVGTLIFIYSKGY
ncbi:MAG: NADH-quinone oxidoreductase subunit L, partial [Actinobacteria bacterium]|nr:NADH-quinone oxidoreductase subunit L [Actinomycetota bacterium]